jgi:hypothetical protein
MTARLGIRSHATDVAHDRPAGQAWPWDFGEGKVRQTEASWQVFTIMAAMACAATRWVQAALRRSRERVFRGVRLGGTMDSRIIGIG